VICLPLGAYSFYVKAIVVFILYAACGILLTRKASKRESNISLVILGIPPLLVYSFVHITEFKDTIIAFTSSFAFLLGILFAILWNSKIRKSFLIGATLIILPIWSIVLTDQFIRYADTSEVKVGSNAKLKQIVITDRTGENRAEDLLQYKILILNFWNTGCGVCKKEFPIFNSIYTDLKNKAGVKIISVNVPLQRDSIDQAHNYVAAAGYKFPVYYMEQKEAFEAFGITSYPTILMIKGGNKVELIEDINELETTILSAE
jgi:thiol-disulfide isomerase/thioredoxin